MAYITPLISCVHISYCRALKVATSSGSIAHFSITILLHLIGLLGTWGMFGWYVELCECYIVYVLYVYTMLCINVLIIVVLCMYVYTMLCINVLIVVLCIVYLVHTAYLHWTCTCTYVHNIIMWLTCDYHVIIMWYIITFL